MKYQHKTEDQLIPKGRRVSYKTNRINKKDDWMYTEYKHFTQKLQMQVKEEIKINFDQKDKLKHKLKPNNINGNKNNKQLNQIKSKQTKVNTMMESRSPSKSIAKINKVNSKQKFKISANKNNKLNTSQKLRSTSKSNQKVKIKLQNNSKSKINKNIKQKTNQKSKQKYKQKQSKEKSQKIIKPIKKYTDLKQSKVKKTSKKPTFKNKSIKSQQEPPQKNQQFQQVIKSTPIKQKKKCITIIHQRFLLEQKNKLKNKAAIVIQSWWRGYKVRKQIEQQYLNLLKQQEQIINKKNEIIIPQLKLKQDSPQKIYEELEQIMKIKQQLNSYLAHVKEMKLNLDEPIKQSQKQNQRILIVQQEQQKDIQRQKKNKHNRKKLLLYIKWQNCINLRIKSQQNQQQETQQNVGFSTNCYIIKRYIQKLNNYIEEHYYEEFHTNLRKPYGFTPLRRLSLLHQYQQQQYQSFSDEILHFVIKQSIFDQFQNISTKTFKYSEYQKNHHRAIFDSYNQVLTTLRPFFKQSSEPYPWTILNHKIANTNQEILNLALNKIMDISSNLCGLIVQNPVQQQQNDQMWLFAKRQQRLKRFLDKWISESKDVWFYIEDQKTQYLLEVSDNIVNQLLEEFCKNLQKIQSKRNLIF